MGMKSSKWHPLDLTNQTYGFWTVIRLHTTTPRRMWVCRCDCGNEKIIRATRLTSGESKSCGCKAAKIARDNGTPRGKTPKPIGDRFWDKVNKDGPVPQHVPHLGKCWVWTGAKAHKGYGAISGEGFRSKRDLAHRVSWRLHHGDVPQGLWVLHKCDNPPCVRPDHLFLGTSQDNHADMMRKGRHAHGVRRPRAA